MTPAEPLPLGSAVRVRFPAAADRNVNMMPFVPARASETLPPDLLPYAGLVAACEPPEPGAVHYLTVTEGRVSHPSGTHRRGGAHTEGGIFGGGPAGWPGSPWGRSGVWMASTVAGSCRVWSTRVKDGDLGPGGCCAHLDLSAVPSRTLGAGELVQIGDRVPHESLPLAPGTPRQFFRLVGPAIGVWFDRHSTANPLCPLPASVHVVRGNKFGDAA